MSSNAKCVACGYNSGSMTHNFCGSDSISPGPSPTPPGPTPAPSPSTCVDADANCPYYVNQGYCASSSQYYQWMTQMCPRACGFCSAPTPKPTPIPAPTPCEDSETSCSFWVGQGYCQHNSTYYAFMTTLSK